jgi:hypothetical protein
MVNDTKMPIWRAQEIMTSPDKSESFTGKQSSRSYRQIRHVKARRAMTLVRYPDVLWSTLDAIRHLHRQDVPTQGSGDHSPRCIVDNTSL